MQALHINLYTFSGATNKENLSNNQEFLQLVIISFLIVQYDLPGENKEDCFLRVNPAPYLRLIR